MKHYLLLFICLFQVFLISCQEPVSYVVATDVQKIFDNNRKGKAITVEESLLLETIIFDSVQANTVGKRIPEIKIKDLANQSLNLQEVLTSKSIIISSDVHCAYGYECLTNAFPTALKKLEAETFAVPIICLLKKTPEDYDDSTKLNETIEKLRPHYKKIYLIDEQEAAKINMLGNPERFYITEDQVISKMASGSNWDADKLYQEVKQNMAL